MRNSSKAFCAVLLLGSLAVASPVSASSGSFNCGPSLRLRIATNLGPNPATIVHKVDNITINSTYGVSLTSYKTQVSGTWSATPSGSISCVV